jgi:hypothetical protein
MNRTYASLLELEELLVQLGVGDGFDRVDRYPLVHCDVREQAHSANVSHLYAIHV